MEVDVSNIPTAERKIHGGGPGEQQYLVIYELATLNNLNPVEWKKHIEATRIGKDILEKWHDVQPESYWLDFTMHAPKK
jgi:hypothetical protein